MDDIIYLFILLIKFFKKSHTSISYVATHFEKNTHFEIFFQSALNLGPNQRTLKKNFKVR